jgi:hypothetical protein
MADGARERVLEVFVALGMGGSLAWGQGRAGVLAASRAAAFRGAATVRCMQYAVYAKRYQHVIDAAHENRIFTVMAKRTDPRVIMPMSQEMITAIDDYRFDTRKPSRLAAITELLEQALKANGITPGIPSPGKTRRPSGKPAAD